NCGFPGSDVDTVVMREIFCDHRAVECHESGGIGEAGEQRSHVAVTDKYLGMTDNFLRVERAQQVIGSVSPSGADDGPNVIAFEHLLEFGDPALHRSREIQILAEN